MEFGSFVDHLTFLAGLLYAAVHHSGDKPALGWRVDWKIIGLRRD